MSPLLLLLPAQLLQRQLPLEAVPAQPLLARALRPDREAAGHLLKLLHAQPDEGVDGGHAGVCWSLQGWGLMWKPNIGPYLS